MTVFSVGTAGSISMSHLDFSVLLNSIVQSSNSTSITVIAGGGSSPPVYIGYGAAYGSDISAPPSDMTTAQEVITLSGSGFTSGYTGYTYHYDYGSGSGYGYNGPTLGGMISAMEDDLGTTMNFRISGLSLSGAQFDGYLTSANNAGLLTNVMSGDDLLQGGSFDDRLQGFAGNDSIDGGNGVDTAVYAGPLSNYQIGLNGTDPVSVTGMGASAGDGHDILSNIEQLQFSDYNDVFDLHSSQDLLVYEIYQAAYGRVPDNAGFRYWAGVADTHNTPSLALADAFLSAPEFTQVYGANPTNLQYVTELYEHVLGREPDQAGLNYWVGQADAGQPRDQLLIDFAISSENVSLIQPHIDTGFLTTQ